MNHVASSGPSPATPAAEPTLRALAASGFLPALVFEIANGAVAPVIPLSALALHGDAGKAAFMLALLGIGRVAGDVPAASLADRIGERRAMLVSAALSVAGFLACAVAPNLLVFGLAMLLLGACSAVFYLARQTYLMEAAPIRLRARVMSTLAGAHRIGLFIGPFLGAGAIGLMGLRGAYIVAMVASIATALLLLVVPGVAGLPQAAGAVRNLVTSRQSLGGNLRLFATLGMAVLAVGAVRAGRQTVLPLWAEHIHIDAATTSVIFGIAGAVDMLLFYPSGHVMDQHGRLAVALPAMLVMGVAMVALPFTTTALTLTLIAVLMSLGNGIGSGIMMTLGADAAPLVGRVPFLGLWRLVGDAGNAVGPVVISVVAYMFTLAAGIASMGIVGILAAVGLWRWAPRYTPYATHGPARKPRRQVD
jgi:MFS family permease